MGQDGEDGESGDAGEDLTTSPQRPAFEDEIRDALRYERGLLIMALLALALVTAIVTVRTLYFA
jgi:hypothetical protein